MIALSPSDPREFGPYRAVAELGEGGMGRVLLGAAPDGRLAAIKVVHAQFADDQEFRARFQREIDASRTVSGAYTAAVMAADAVGPVPWLASVFVPGPTLRAAVATAGVLSESAARVLVAGLASALADIHRAGLVHRDLKPANVILAADGVRVIDFGIARAAESAGSDLTQTGIAIGTPGFMSPEQAEGRDLTPASDVFALGAVLVMATTGQSPFAGASAPQILYNVVHTEPDYRAVPPGLRAIAQACLAKDPAARPTPAEVLRLLGSVAPATRPWPVGVHRMLAAQQADVDRFLGDADRTVVDLDATVPDLSAVAPTVAGQTVARWQWQQPPVQAMPPPLPPKPTGAATIVVVSLVVVLLAGLGVGAYLLWGGEETPAQSAQGDKYRRAPTCAEVGDSLRLGERHTDTDNHSDTATMSDTRCYWVGYEDVDGKRYWDNGWHALVLWKLLHTRGAENGTAALDKEFDAAAKGSPPEPGLGDEAYWDAAAAGEGGCDLVVRDGNVLVTVALREPQHPRDTCEAEAREVARAALAGVS